MASNKSCAAMMVGWMAAFLFPGLALAANWAVCNGTPVKWESGHFGVVRNRCSIPDSGDVNDSYWNAIEQWKSVSPVINDTAVWPADRCSMDHTDGYTDVGIVSRGDIDGNDGLTMVYLDGCTFSWETEHILEADIMVASDMTFHNPDESQWTDAEDSGRMTMMHEFGHAHGFLHTNAFSVMRAGRRPYVGGTGDHVAILPDDALGLRTLYGGGSSYRNLIVSSQRFSGGTVVTTNPPGTIDVCRNQPVSIGFTVGNTGTLAVDTFGMRLFINNKSPSGGGFTGGWTLGSWNAGVNGPGLWSTDFSARVPNVPPGIYWLYLRADDTGLVSELREHDNVTHNPMTFKVLDCWSP